MIPMLPSQTVHRFKTLLSSFTHAPWTLQRLCELVLEPRKQYTQLHKVQEGKAPGLSVCPRAGDHHEAGPNATREARGHKNV